MRICFHSFGGFCRDIAGSAAVEFAVTVPVLILLMFGMIETGRALWAQNSLQYAVERATRCRVVYLTCNNDGYTSCGVCSSDTATQTYAAGQVYYHYDGTVNSSAFTVSHPNSGKTLCVASSFAFLPAFQNLTNLPIVRNVSIMPPITLTSNSCRPVPPAS